MFELYQMSWRQLHHKQEQHLKFVKNSNNSEKETENLYRLHFDNKRHQECGNVLVQQYPIICEMEEKTGFSSIPKLRVQPFRCLEEQFFWSRIQLEQ